MRVPGPQARDKARRTRSWPSLGSSEARAGASSNVMPRASGGGYQSNQRSNAAARSAMSIAVSCTYRGHPRHRLVGSTRVGFRRSDPSARSCARANERFLDGAISVLDALVFTIGDVHVPSVNEHARHVAQHARARLVAARPIAAQELAPALRALRGELQVERAPHRAKDLRRIRQRECARVRHAAHRPTRDRRQCRCLRGHRIFAGGLDRPRQRPWRSLGCAVCTADLRRRFSSLR